YGTTGTQPKNTAEVAGVTQNTMAPYGGGLNNRFFANGNWNTIAYAPNQNFNPYLEWETNKELNVGLDFGLMRGRVSGSIDYYRKEVENLIYTYSVPTPPNMFPTSVLDVGTLRNSGIELLLRSDILKKSDFGVNAT